jgi:hypothetical protein
MSPRIESGTLQTERHAIPLHHADWHSNFRLKFVDSKTENKIWLHDGINEYVCSSACLSRAHLFSWHKTDRKKCSVENIYMYKIYFSTAYLYKKSLGNFFYHLTTLPRNKESKWKRTVRLDTLIYRYYFYLFPALLIYQFGIYMPRICTCIEPKCSILRWKQLVKSRFPGPDDPIHITSTSLL